MSLRARKRYLMPKSRGPAYWGRRCREDYPGCIKCDAYKWLELRGRFPYHFDEPEFWQFHMERKAESEAAYAAREKA